MEGARIQLLGTAVHKEDWRSCPPSFRMCCKAAVIRVVWCQGEEKSPGAVLTNTPGWILKKHPEEFS